VEFTTSEYCEYVLYRMYYRYHTERPERHGYTDSHFGQCHGGVFSPYANMYCTECIIGIIQNAGTPSRLRFTRTRHDEGRRERQASNYGSPFLHTTETHS